MMRTDVKMKSTVFYKGFSTLERDIRLKRTNTRKLVNHLGRRTMASILLVI